MKTKFILGLVLILGGIGAIIWLQTRSSPAPALKVMIDIPEIYRDGKLSFPRTLENRYPKYDHFFVVIQNISPKPVIIPDEDDMNRLLRFEITTDDGKTATLYRNMLEHAKYFPYDLRLAPGAVAVREIYYGRDWEPFPFPHDPHRALSTRKVTLRAIFEQKAAKDTVRASTWTGSVVAPPCEVVLEDNPS
jgi:hypothetical protein